jgi:hypothetical protein
MNPDLCMIPGCKEALTETDRHRCGDDDQSPALRMVVRMCSATSREPCSVK